MFVSVDSDKSLAFSNLVVFRPQLMKKMLQTMGGSTVLNNEQKEPFDSLLRPTGLPSWRILQVTGIEISTIPSFPLSDSLRIVAMTRVVLSTVSSLHNHCRR